jgi:hypothetical protein
VVSGTVANLIYGKPDYIKIGSYGTAEGSCTNVGYSDGGVNVKWNPKYTNRMVDQVIGPVKANLDEVMAQVEITLAEASMDNLRLAMGLPSAAVSSSVMSIGANIGAPGSEPNYLTVYMQGAGPGGASATRHVKIQKCYSSGSVEEKFEKGKKVYKITLDLIYDTTAAANQEYMVITDSSGDTTAPMISSTSPADTDVDVAVAANMTATFAEAINGADVTGVYFKVVKTTDGTGVAGSLSLSADKTIVTFNPTSNLGNSTAYLWIISQGVRDLAGNRLAADTYVNFTTVA